MAESLGITLPSNAAIPAVDSRRYVLAQLAGSRIVEMVKEDLKMSKVMTRASFLNAIRTNAAIGGSTNAIVHLLAIAGRLGVRLTLDDFQEFGSKVPLLVNLKPSGKFLMEDFYYAGGLPPVIRELISGSKFDAEALTVNGFKIGENVKDAPCYNKEVISSFSNPLKPSAGITVLRGNICSQGAIIKPSAATPKLLQHRGRAVVFENVEQMKEQIDDPHLDVDESCVLVLKGAGPKGYPGMPEVGNMPIPKKVLEKGITDMVRISDARMSGTAYGTVVLHISPESCIGGPLAFIQNGDIIELDTPAQRLHLCVSDEVLELRRKQWMPATIPPEYQRGYVKLYMDHVTQADKGADLDFLVGKSGTYPLRESH